MLKAIVEDFGNGGTIDGDLVVSGDLTVSGGGSLSFDEIIEGTQQIKVTSTTALLVEKADGTDVFTVDTTNSAVEVGGHLTLPDASGSGGVLKLGASEDIQIYHDGSNSYLDHLNTGNLNIRSLRHGGDIKFHTEASDGTQHSILTLSNDSSATFSGDVTVSKSSDGGDSSLTINNSASHGSTDETASLKFQQAGYTGGKIVSNRAFNYSSAGNRDSTLQFYTSQDATDTLAMTIDANQNVGIGDASPDYKLDVETTANSDVTVANFQSAIDANGEHSIIRVGHGSKAAYMGLLLNSSDTAYFGIDDNPDDGNGIYVNESASVGIGTKNPNVKNHIFGGSASQENILLKVQSNAVTNDGSLSTSILLANSTGLDSTHGAKIQAIRTGSGTDDLVFHTFNSSLIEAMRIDSSQNVGIGSSPIVRLGQKLSTATSANYGGASLNTYSTDNGHSSVLDFNKSGNATIGSHTAVADDEDLGYIIFRGSDGVEFLDACYIRANVDGAVTGGGTNDMPGRLTFWTTADGSSSPTERMRIDSSGKVGIAGNISLNKSSANQYILKNTGGSLRLKHEGTSAGDDIILELSDGGKQHIFDHDGSSTFAGAITSGGNVNIPAGNLLYLDGGTDTYIYQETDNKISFATNSGVRLSIDNSSATFSGILNVSGAGLKITGANTAHLASSLVFGQDTSALSQIRAYGADDSTAGTLEFRMTSSAGAVNQGVMKLDVNSRISLTNNDAGGSGGSDGLSANTIFGYLAGQDIASGGVDNTYFGHKAGSNNATGDDNTFVGSNAGKGSHGNSHSSNVGVGSDALLAVSTGSYNAVMGNAAAKAMTDGHNNIAIGNQALMTSTSAGICVVIGDDAMKNGNATQDGTIAIGGSALYALTTGAGNTAVGHQALDATATGQYNTAVGFEALTSLPDGGDQNTAIGWKALHSATSSACDNLTALGYKAGFQISTGFNNTFIGANVDANTGNFDNVTAIGNNFEADASDGVFLGNTSVSVIKAQVTSITAYSSDERTKKDIKDYDLKGVDFIKDLQLKTYVYKNPADYPDEIRSDKWDKKDEDGNLLYEKPKDSSATQVGLIAQEVEEALAKHNVGNTETYAPTQDSGIKTLTYGNLIFPLIKAVQELSARVEELEKK